MTAPAIRAWNDCLLAASICTALYEAERLGRTISGNGTAVHEGIARDSREVFGGLTTVHIKCQIGATSGEYRTRPTGGAVFALWSQLEAVRDEWRAMSMIEAGFPRRWKEKTGGDVYRRAVELWARLDGEIPSVEDALHEHKHLHDFKMALSA
jgi:hypothetical protein